MLKSVRSMLSLVIPLLFLLYIAVLGAITYLSMHENAIENGISITNLTADTRHEMFLRYVKRQRLQATNFIIRSRRLCSMMNIAKINCLQTALDGYIATIDAEFASMKISGLPLMKSGVEDKFFKYKSPLDEKIKFEVNKKGVPYFVLHARTDDGRDMLTLHLKLVVVDEIFKNPEQLGEFGETFLVTGANLFIPSPTSQFITLTKEVEIKGDDNIQKCQKGKSFNVSNYTIFQKKVLASFLHVKELDDGCIIAILQKNHALASLNKLKGKWITLIIIFASLASLIGYLFTKKIIDPMSELSKIALSLQAGKFDIDNLSSGGPKEIQLFEKTFKKMARSLKIQITNQEEMMFIVSHDLSNPVAAIKLSAQLGLRTLGKSQIINNKEALVKYLSGIEKQTEQMQRLINDLLNVARVQTGKLEVNLQKIRISQLLPVIETMKSLAMTKSISLKISFANEDLEILADLDRITQVFSNLIGNALKFTPIGGQIIVGQKEQADSVLFWVRDTGTGIPQEQLLHIFLKHWQAHGEQKKGVGLGLFISKAIIDDHGGKIWVESELNFGTCFYFTLKKVINS